MKTIALKKDATVFWEGDPGSCMYRIREGRVGVYKDYATIRQKKLAELGAGDFFGEMGLIDRMPRSATVVGLDRETVLERIDESDFGQFLSENPETVDRIIRQLSHKLRQTTKDYLDICQSIASTTGGSEDIDDDSDYHFGDNKHLRTIHDTEAAARENV